MRSDSQPSKKFVLRNTKADILHSSQTCKFRVFFCFCVAERSGRYGTQEWLASPHDFVICQFVASCFHKHRYIKVNVSLFTPRRRKFSGDGKVNVKVKFTLKQATKVQKGE